MSRRPAPVSGSARGARLALAAGIVVGGLLVVGVLGTIVFHAVRRYVERAGEARGPEGSAPLSLAAKVPSKAHGHVPSGCELVLRLDVARVLAHPAFSTHVAPALGELDRQPDPKAKSAKELLTRAGLDPRKDLEEAIVCFVGLDRPKAEQKFAVVVGGQLRPEAVVPAFEAVEVPKPTITMLEGRKVASGRGDDGLPVMLGQAADGAIVFASDRALFESAIAGTAATPATYGLPIDVEASAVVTRAFLANAARQGGGDASPLAREVAAMTEAAATLTLSSPKAEVRMRMATAQDAARFHQTLVTLLLPGFREELAHGPSQFGEVEALQAARARVENTDVIVELPWTQQGVEQIAKQIAGEIRKAKLDDIGL